MQSSPLGLCCLWRFLGNDLNLPLIRVGGLKVGIRRLQLSVKNLTFGYSSAQTLLPMPDIDRARPQAGPQEDKHHRRKVSVPLTSGSGWSASRRGTAGRLWCGSPWPSLRTGDREKASGHSSWGCGQIVQVVCPHSQASRVQTA